MRRAVALRLFWDLGRSALFNFRSGLRGFQSFPSGSLVEIIAVSCGTIVLLIFIIQSKRASDSHELRLVSEFREIVREPVPDPNDPRFKNWNVRERFPWGWQIVQQQLHERVARREREYDQSLKG